MDIVALEQEAIKASLNQDWVVAVTLNNQVILLDPENIDALNRLGRAYIELGRKKEARKCFKKVLRLDPINTIAQKNIEVLEKRGFAPPKMPSENGTAFVKQPGTDTTVEVETSASKLRLRKLVPGDILTLKPKRKNKFSIFGPKDSFLGIITDGLSNKLRQAVVKNQDLRGTFVSAEEKSIKIIVKGQVAVFREKERQEVRPYVLPEELPEEPELDQTPLEEKTEEEEAKEPQLTSIRE